MTTRSTQHANPTQKETLPSIIMDPATKTTYKRGQFMGKGGFARCYELQDIRTNTIYAGKVVPKALLVKPYHKDKMAQEINIHRSLQHPHIVQFYNFFEDNENVYILLELCRRKSLMELHKRRKTITEPECRYFILQIVEACRYLQNLKIIHRDLKLGNIFLDDEMQIKIGDFGLATKLDFDGERKRTLCGTPNYIAPEILCKKGHSFEVDAWSLGCIIFTLLVGKPPFETQNLKDTYARIKKNEYEVPSRISPLARNLIQRLLHPDPAKRPTMESIANDDYITKSYIPSRLPTSCLSMAPRFDSNASFAGVSVSRKPLLEINKMEAKTVGGKKPPTIDDNDKLKSTPFEEVEEKDNEIKTPKDYYLSELREQIGEFLSCKPTDRAYIQIDEAEDPAIAPMLWVSKWVDYSDRYGLGYCLCDNSVGVMFNDATKIVLLADALNFHYIERDGRENYYTLKNYPSELQKKVTLLNYFQDYMSEHLLNTGEGIVPRDGDQLARLPYMSAWFRTKNAIVLHLTNGTLQVNFLEDHTKVIVCPLMNAVTYIDSSARCTTYRIKLFEKYGCTKEVMSRLKYAYTMIDKFTSTPNKKGTAKKVV